MSFLLQAASTVVGYAGYAALKTVSYGADIMAPVVKEGASLAGSAINETAQFLGPKAWTLTGYAVEGLVNATCYLAPKAGAVAYYTGSALLTATEQTVGATLNVTGVGLRGVGAIKHANPTNNLIALIGAACLAKIAYDEKETKKKIVYGAIAGLLLFA